MSTQSGQPSLRDLPAARRRKAAGGYAPALECGSPSLREGCPPVLVLMARRETRFAHCVRYARTIATSQNTMRAGARGHEPCVPRRRICRCRRTPTHGFTGTTVPFGEHHNPCCAVGGTRGGRFVGRREGEPGHGQSGGLAVPGEQSGPWARRGLQGQQRGRRARSARFVLAAIVRAQRTKGLKRVSPRDRAARIAAKSARGADRHSRSPQRAPPVAPRHFFARPKHHSHRPR